MTAAEVGGLDAADELGSLDSASITVCPDGPLLVRGPVQLRTVDGESIAHGRPVIALCRCGRSRLKPLCDGSHRLATFRDAAEAEQISRVLRQPASDA